MSELDSERKTDYENRGDIVKKMILDIWAFTRTTMYVSPSPNWVKEKSTHPDWGGHANAILLLFLLYIEPCDVKQGWIYLLGILKVQQLSSSHNLKFSAGESECERI